MTGQPEPPLVRARASINLPGLPLGRVALVDPADPYVADAISRGFLAPEATVEEEEA